MITIRQYLMASSLEEAWKNNQKRSNRVLGGMGWMKMSKGNLAAAIDLSGLGLDQIEEKEEEFIIGAMVTLRQIELHKGLALYFEGAFKESVRHIVGIQFRNCATLGGSVWLRAGFSDPLTLLLALDSYVELYQGEEKHVLMSMEEFCKSKPDKSILVSIHVKKDQSRVVYDSFRNTETDFPVLTLALSKKGDMWTAAIGARPYLAQKIQAQNPDALVKKALELKYQTNLRASAEYRKALAEVLIGRAIKSFKGEK